MPVNTHFSDSGATFTIAIDGDFNFALLHEFRNSYTNKEAESAKNIIIDLRKTDTVDSSSLGMILNLQNHLNKSDGEIKIINANKVVANILKITNFSKKFTIE